MPINANDQKTYANPVTNLSAGDGTLHMGDPYVLQHAGQYYLFGTTSSDEGFQYYQSSDLVHWQPKGWAWRMTPDAWATGPFWAPEVKYYRGRFYLTYSGMAKGVTPPRLMLAAAVSDNPGGPYQDLYAPWFDLGFTTIDSNLYFEEGGAPYLYFSRHSLQPNGFLKASIFGVELTQDLSKLVGQPVELLEADQLWERTIWPHSWCNEGSTLFKHGSTYYLTYSAGDTVLPIYAVGYATASHPLGPWRKGADNPILATQLEIGVSGPGHNSITHSPDGSEMFIVYHTHADPNNPSGDRIVNIDRLVIDDAGHLKVIGPTRTPQPMPSGY